MTGMPYCKSLKSTPGLTPFIYLYVYIFLLLYLYLYLYLYFSFSNTLIMTGMPYCKSPITYGLTASLGFTSVADGRTRAVLFFRNCQDGDVHAHTCDAVDDHGSSLRCTHGVEVEGSSSKKKPKGSG